jgi:hypothetical protein
VTAQCQGRTGVHAGRLLEAAVEGSPATENLSTQSST